VAEGAIRFSTLSVKPEPIAWTLQTKSFRCLHNDLSRRKRPAPRKDIQIEKIVPENKPAWFLCVVSRALSPHLGHPRDDGPLL